MSSHVVVLYDGSPDGAYADEATPFYGAGGAYKYPLLARVTRAAGGHTQTLKVQGAALPINTCVFATRGPGGEQGELQIAALSGDTYRVILTQQSGASQSTSHDFSDDLLTLLLPTDAGSHPAGKVSDMAVYINANLSSDFVATSSGSPRGVLGSTLIERPCPRASWSDVVSTVGGLLPATVEHVLDPGVGGSSDYNIEVDVRNYEAIRVLVKASGDANPDDHVTVLVLEEGA